MAHRVEVQDHASTGQGARCEAQLRAAADRFAAAGHGLRRPLRAVLESRLLVPGFLETQAERHVLHLQAGAASEPWFPGLLIREVAHAVLGDEGHASHDPGLLQESFAAARERSRDLAFLSLTAAVNHHVRDAYADDLAAKIEPDAVTPFLAHLAEVAARAEGSPAERAVEIGYAAGTLMRRGVAAPAALRGALAADAEARRLADRFSALHPDPEEADLAQAVVRIIHALPRPGETHAP